MLVIDASAMIELLLARSRGRYVEQEVLAHNFDLHAPHLLDVEVLSALRRLVATGEAPAERADDAVADFMDLPVERYAHCDLAPRIWDLRASFSAYDAAYVALAEAIVDDGAPLLTADSRLARTAGAHTDLQVMLAD